MPQKGQITRHEWGGIEPRSFIHSARTVCKHCGTIKYLDGKKIFGFIKNGKAIITYYPKCITRKKPENGTL